MSVNLTWGAANAALAESINIYRSTSMIDVNNLPVALASVAGNVSSYMDTTAVRNTTYYYAVGHVRLGQELVSPVFIMGHYPDTGPGPQTLLRGDWNCGYFGMATTAQLFLPSTLNAQVSLPGTLTADVNTTGWYKFIRKGKIIYIPNYVFSTGVYWCSIYNKGLMFGTNDNGGFPFTPSAGSLAQYTAPVNQYKLATSGSYQFVVRTIRASDLPTTSFVQAADCIGGELWDLFGRLGPTASAAAPQDKWNDIVSTANMATSHAQQFSGASSAWYCNSFDTPAVKTTSGASEVTTYWFPVLELVLV